MSVIAGAASDGLVLRKHFEGDESWLEIVAAEPRALFSAELLDIIAKGESAPLGVTLDRAAIGGELRIRARGRSLVYRLVEQDFERDLYVGQWPD